MHLLDFGEGKNRTGILTPIPQYPLYTATLTEMNLTQVIKFIYMSNILYVFPELKSV